MSHAPRRAALYMPASNPRALAKAPTLGVDVVILDLEDAVAPETKREARQALVAQLGLDHGSTTLTARVNGLDSQWGAEDLEAVIPAGPHAVVVPKVSTASQLEEICTRVSDMAPQVRVWPMLETPLAIMNAAEISAAARRSGGQVDCFLVGTNDLAKDTGADAGNGRAMLLPWLSTMVACAKAAGATILDGTYNDFRDPDGLRQECIQGRALGMDGKTIIHPAQIETTIRAFSPGDDELSWAEAVVAAFARPENADRGVIAIDGKMVERLHLAMAKRILASR